MPLLPNSAFNLVVRNLVGKLCLIQPSRMPCVRSPMTQML